MLGVESRSHHHMEGWGRLSGELRGDSVVRKAGNDNGLNQESTGNWLLTTGTTPNNTKQSLQPPSPQSHYHTAGFLPHCNHTAGFTGWVQYVTVWVRCGK